MSFSLAIRRIAVTLLLALGLFMVASLINVNAATVFFFVAWPTLFFAWSYLSRKFGFDFPRAPQPRARRPTDWGRLLTTGAAALLIACTLIAWLGPGAIGTFSFLWFVLYYSWPLLIRWLPFLNFVKTGIFTTNSTRPLWLRMLRGTGAWIAGFVLAVTAFGSLSMSPLLFCYGRAQRAHDSVRIGMTVPDVLHTVRDCDIFQASSDFPDDGDDNHIPAMGLGRTPDGKYHTLDSGLDQTLSESEAIERLHMKLHDGYRWTFHYTYTNLTPQHVSFSVVFGPDGRVTELKPVYGWD